MQDGENIVMAVVTQKPDIAAHLLEVLTCYPGAASTCYAMRNDKPLSVATDEEIMVLEIFLPLEEGILFMAFLNKTYPKLQALVFSEQPIRTEENADYLKVVTQEIPMKSSQFGMN